MANVGVDVAVGLVFAFWVFSLVAAGVTEASSNLVSKRGKDLVRGLRALLDAPEANGSSKKDTTDLWKASTAGGVTAKVLAHPLLQSLQRPGREGKNPKPPSYIPSRAFARALLDTLVPADQADPDFSALKAAVREQLPVEAQRPLLQLIDEAGKDVKVLRDGVEQWFDDQMERVSGWYKRWAKKVALVVALVVTVVLNVDTVAMATSLYRDPAVREAVVAQADDEAVDDLKSTGLPLGWKCLDDEGDADWTNCFDQSTSRAASLALGWLLTVGAISLGAPFWFDTMSRIGSLRNAGPKPDPTKGP